MENKTSTKSIIGIILFLIVLIVGGLWYFSDGEDQEEQTPITVPQTETTPIPKEDKEYPNKG